MSKHYPIARGIALASLALALILPAMTHAASLPPATATPIQHFVVLMEEDRSFDSYFSNYPGTEPIPRNTCVPMGQEAGNCLKPYSLHDHTLDHLSETQRKYSNLLTLGYYTDQEVPYFWNVAEQYVLFDHYFSSVKSSNGTISPNKMYAIAGTAVTSTKVTIGGYDHFTTIFDRLHAKGIPWKMYVQGYNAGVNFRSVKAGDKVPNQITKVPLLSFGRFIDNPTLKANIVDLDEYYNDLHNGTLPAVSYLVVNGATAATSGNLLVAQRHLKSVMQALMRSSVWDSSALLWTHDQSGGWYDHVTPPTVNKSNLGLRVPAMLISPYARIGKVDSTVLEHSSIIKFIEYNWNLESLGQHDKTANSVVVGFDFNQKPRPSTYLSMTRSVVIDTETVKPARIWIFVLYGIAWVIAILIMATLLIGLPQRASLLSTHIASPRQSIS